MKVDIDQKGEQPARRVEIVLSDGQMFVLIERNDGDGPVLCVTGENSMIVRPKASNCVRLQEGEA